MKISYRILAPLAALAMTTGLLAQTTTPPPTTPPTTPPEKTKPEHPATPNEHASDNAKAVHALLDQFKAQRDGFMDARKALLEKLKTATDEEKKAILEQLRADQKDRADEQKALGKQIRDELQKLRENRKKGGG